MDEKAIEYVKARTKYEKTKVIADLIEKIRRDSPSGGFVKQDFYSGCWHEIGLERARDKVGHAIRKAADIIVDQNKGRKGKKGALAVAANKDFYRKSNAVSMGGGHASKTPSDGDALASTTSASIFQAMGTANRASIPDSYSPFQGRLTPPELLQRYNSLQQTIISDACPFPNQFLSTWQSGSNSAGAPYSETHRLSGDSLHAAISYLVNDNSFAPTPFQQRQCSYGSDDLPSCVEGVPSFHSMHGTASQGRSPKSNVGSSSDLLPAPTYIDAQSTTGIYPELGPLGANTGSFTSVGDSLPRPLEKQPSTRGNGPASYQSGNSNLPSTTGSAHENAAWAYGVAAYGYQPEEYNPRSNLPPEYYHRDDA